MAYCPSCGAQMADRAQYCGACGKGVGRAPLVTPTSCPDCGFMTDAMTRCRRCQRLLVTDSRMFAAGLWRRFWAYLLESLLVTLTLIVGWLIWFYFTAKESTTPAKKMLGLKVLHVDGRDASAGTMWVRELLIKQLLWGVVGSILLGASIIAYLWAFWDKEKQTLHDKMVNTIVVYSPPAPSAVVQPSP